MVEESVPGVFPQPAGIFECRGRECTCEQMSSMAEESAIVDVKPEVYIPSFVICFCGIYFFRMHSNLSKRFGCCVLVTIISMDPISFGNGRSECWERDSADSGSWGVETFVGIVGMNFWSWFPTRNLNSFCTKLLELVRVWYFGLGYACVYLLGRVAL